jgi:hypothetical protein
MSIDRRGFLGGLGALLGGIIMPKVPVLPDTLEVVIDVRSWAEIRKKGKKGTPLPPSYLAGNNWPFGPGPYREFPQEPLFENKGQIECIGCSMASSPISRDYSDATKEERILRVNFPEQDISRITGLKCEGKAVRIYSTSADHVELAVGWDVGWVKLTFEVA